MSIFSYDFFERVQPKLDYFISKIDNSLLNGLYGLIFLKFLLSHQVPITQDYVVILSS
jgi:hypothetical protein